MRDYDIIQRIGSVRQQLTPHGIIAWAIIRAAYIIAAAIRGESE